MQPGVKWCAHNVLSSNNFELANLIAKRNNQVRYCDISYFIGRKCTWNSIFFFLAFCPLRSKKWGSSLIAGHTYFYWYICLSHSRGVKIKKTVAAFWEMHESPAKHRYAWQPRKCDYQTKRRTEKMIHLCGYASQVTLKPNEKKQTFHFLIIIQYACTKVCINKQLRINSKLWKVSLSHMIMTFINCKLWKKGTHTHTHEVNQIMYKS